MAVVTAPQETSPAACVFISPDDSHPLRAEAFGVEHLEQYARELAAASVVADQPGLRQPLLRRFQDNGRVLAEVYQLISTSAAQGEALSPDAEWLVDNYFIIANVLREVKQDLPTGYYAELPILAEGSTRGYPRIFALALGLIVHTDSSLDENEIARFVRAYQSVVPLSIGELWAVPTMLRLGLVENLRRLAQQLLQTRADRERAFAWARQQLARPPVSVGHVVSPEHLSDTFVVGLLQSLRDQGTAGPTVEWLEQWLIQQGGTVGDVLRREHQHQAANQVSIGNAITTLRLLGALDWSHFFEQASQVEALLRQDPAGAYPRQDFATRDRYRRVVEKLARGSKVAEEDVARRVLDRAEAEGDQLKRHVGYYLIDDGRHALKRELGYRPRWGDWLRGSVHAHPNGIYFGALLILFVAAVFGVTALTGVHGFGMTLLVALALLLPASEIAVRFVHFLVTRLLPPSVLPKLDFKDGLPADCATFVVIPGMLTRPDSADRLLERLELHYLANPDPQLHFALLTDFADAASETLPEDGPLVQAALAGVAALNERYAAAGEPRFFVFHRKRLWNASENRWMGWERKRGKLLEFNLLLRGSTTTSFATCSAPPDRLPFVRYVLTLDADTNLPREVARRLIGTLAHPLNKAEYDPTRRRVVRGYGLLQPRVSFLYDTGLRSRFARLYAGSAGVDPYSAAVSDVYQDLFSAGSYTGKGLYDIDAFEKATGAAFPDNHVLSHDLIESNFVRCGLVTDVEVLDDFPAKYPTFARREHRWVRGDWQLLPWLGRTVPTAEPTGRVRNPLPLLARWKIVDNLRRSLLPPALLLLLLLAWTVLPGSALAWTAFVVGIVALPLLLQLLGGVWDMVRGGSPRAVLRSLSDGLPATAGQALLQLTFLSDQVRLMVDAIAVTLYRLYVSRRHLLEWETAAAAEERFSGGLRQSFIVMWPALAVTAGSAVLVAWANPAALPVALPLLFLWLVAPIVSYWVSLPTPARRAALHAHDIQALRRIARLTWNFFEAFIGPEDHWLPPDNYQETRKEQLAHRTSPTNTGLLLLSTLTAHDLGYLDLPGLARRLAETFATLEKLELHEGHFLNWYDTRTLQPLHPAYVSTVDSGNLLSCFLTLEQGLLEVLSQPYPRASDRAGLTDTLELVAEESRAQKSGGRATARNPTVEEHISQARKELALVSRGGLLDWDGKLSRLAAEAAAIVNGSGKTNLWADRFASQIAGFRAELNELSPWVALLHTSAENGQPSAKPSAVWQELRSSLDEPLRLDTWPERRDKILANLKRCEEAGCDAALLSQLTKAVNTSGIEDLTIRLRKLAEQSGAYGGAMDFQFLYNHDRNLFTIGFNLTLARPDNAHYDLLASESIIASFLAIARGEVPRKHWFHLGRPAIHVAGHDGLLSWGGTMFEYLMPRLVLPHFPKTLLDAMQVAAVARQMQYGRQNAVPWGVSESAYNVLDAAQDYQYQSFGVPGLGIKRGLGQDLVVAPYATALATAINPLAACHNFAALRQLGGEGPYGFYEALDFTPGRVPIGKRCEVIRSYMAHHQGMTFVALGNCVLGDLMPRRLQAAPLVRATELLLQERVPHAPPQQQQPAEEAVPHQETEKCEAVSRRITTPHTPGPRTHLLSNGEYTAMVTAAGGGYSACRDNDVTRWREDRTLDGGGHFFYVKDLQSGKYWSAGFQPVRVPPASFEVVYSTDKAEFRRVDDDIETHMDVVVSPEKNVEVRRIALANHGHRPREIEVTSYVEVVLTSHGSDLAHPAFQKLFLETEYLPDHAALLCRRRPRAADQKPIWAIHVLATEHAVSGTQQYETDRARFLGRRRTPANPAALDKSSSLSGTVGSVLDPIFSLRHRVRLQPGTSEVLAFSTGVVDSREEALALTDEFHTLHAITRTFELAWAHACVELRHLNLSTVDVHLFQRLAGHILFAGPILRTDPSILAGNLQNQSGLWRIGVSGDVPIVVVRIGEMDDLPLARLLLFAHTYWRVKGLKVELVILNEHPTSYFEELHEQVQGLLRASDAHVLIDKPGGVFLRKSSHLAEADRNLLLASARVVLAGDQGPLGHQVDVLEKRKALPPLLTTRRQRGGLKDRPQEAPTSLRFANGIGGFAPAGREYLILPDRVPPAPWINVIANPAAGFLISDSGSGYTWVGNSQQNRLTPWSNDPVSDPPGEVIYLRDEDTREVWSPTPLPVAGALPTLVRHAPGCTTFEQQRGGLDQRLRLFVGPEDPVKFFYLTINNRSLVTRRLSATFFAEWVLGTTRDQAAMHIVTEVDATSGALLARNSYGIDFGTSIAFADVLRRPRTLTGDRTEFLGRNGSRGAPAALQRVELSGDVGPALDPCAALQTKFDLAPHAEITLVFVLGQATDRESARRLLERYRTNETVEQALHASESRWQDILSTVQVATPDPAFDTLLNHWLLTQVLSCRLWGRSAFYQSGGAYGFRDQLQDVMALVHAAPAEARAQIVRAASRQFEEGDVQHWWHPPAGRGVRTRMSDDYLWLPFVVCHYVLTTGDRAVLDEPISFLKAPLLAPGEEEVYGQPAVSEQKAPLYDHCARALENGWKLGAHGLPLMGTGDWNDGMNRVGNEGKGESVWVGWFLLACLRRFAEVAEERHDNERAARYRQRADQLKAAIEEHAWDGGWYRRAYFDDGTPLGSAVNDECRIDSLPQTWAVISGAGDQERTGQAMDEVMQQLVRTHDRLILLFTPPFDDGKLHPGYIKGYVPGIRENGGQYTHAATWVVQALALMKRGDKALEMFNLLNPITHTDTPAGVALYRVEPYVVAADVYGRPPHTGRGGWTWYTGSASWLYRVGLEAILGFHRRGHRLEFVPCIPASWEGFTITYRFGRTVYQIEVVNPHKSGHGTARVTLDGGPPQEGGFEMADDGRTHTVRVELLPS